MYLSPDADFLTADKSSPVRAGLCDESGLIDSAKRNAHTDFHRQRIRIVGFWRVVNIAVAFGFPVQLVVANGF